MNLKILYGGLSRELNNKIEELISKSTKNLVGLNLGSKVTLVALKRYLRDPTVSIVLLNETTHNSMQSSLSDDRLVCVINDDTIVNLFESKYGVENEELKTEVNEETDNEELIDEKLDDADKELTWEEILANFEKIGTGSEEGNPTYEEDDTEVESEVDSEDEDIEEPINQEDDDLEAEELLELAVEHEEPKVVSNENINSLKTVISNLRTQIEEQQDFIDNSVGKDDYQELKTSHEQVKSELSDSKTKVEELQSENTEMKLQIDILSNKNKEFKAEIESLGSKNKELTATSSAVTSERDLLLNEKETLLKQINEMKEKFAELLELYKKQKELQNGVSKSKSVNVAPIKRRYPNIEFLVPLSSNSVLELYEYVSSRTDELLFIDLSNDSYIDKYVKMSAVTKPTKWLVDNLNYKKVINSCSNKANLRVITQVVHKMEREVLTQLNWDKVLGDLTTENKVIINIGSIYDSYVVDILKAVQNGVSVVGFLGESARDQRIGKLALSSIDRYKVLASSGTKDKFGIVTDWY